MTRRAARHDRSWRDVHRWCWAACWTPLGAFGVVLGLTMTSLSGTVAVGVAGALGGAVVVGLARGADAPRRGAVLIRVLARHREGPAACACGLGAAGVEASSALLGPATWPLLLLAVLTSPLVVAGLTGWRGGTKKERSPVSCACGCQAPVGAEQLSGVVHLLSDAALVSAWRDSGTRLAAAGSPIAVGGLVVARQAYLDELERRFPEATHDWLTRRASGSPGDVRSWPPDASGSDGRP